MHSVQSGASVMLELRAVMVNVAMRPGRKGDAHAPAAGAFAHAPPDRQPVIPQSNAISTASLPDARVSSAN